MDPEDNFSDIELWSALEGVHLKESVEGWEDKLHYGTVEGGENFSAEERHCLCLARALRQGNQVILSDEATANVDLSKDSLVQEPIRTKLKHCTVISIAHKVNTILDYDKVLVLEKGSIVEFDEPKALIGKKESKFSELCRYQGATT